MEPAVDRREHPAGFLRRVRFPLQRAAMEPAVDRREHAEFAVWAFLRWEAAMEPAVDRREHPG